MEQEKIQQMHFLEQNLQAILMQKQAFQMELSETNSALGEVEKSNEDVYKIVGQLMIKMPKEKIKDELQNKQKLFKLRFETLEKQESELSGQVNKLREEILKSPKK